MCEEGSFPVSNTATPALKKLPYGHWDFPSTCASMPGRLSGSRPILAPSCPPPPQYAGAPHALMRVGLRPHAPHQQRTLYVLTVPGLQMTWPRVTSSRLMPRMSRPTLSPAWPCGGAKAQNGRRRAAGACQQGQTQHGAKCVRAKLASASQIGMQPLGCSLAHHHPHWSRRGVLRRMSGTDMLRPKTKPATEWDIMLREAFRSLCAHAPG